MLQTVPPSPEVIIAIGQLLQPLLETLERITWVQRHLFPPFAPRLADELAPCAQAVGEPLHALEKVEWPDDLRFMRERLIDVARQTVDLVNAFGEAAGAADNPIDLYRAIRRFARIQETLYPLAPAFDPVSRWFLEPARRGQRKPLEALGSGAEIPAVDSAGAVARHRREDVPAMERVARRRQEPLGAIEVDHPAQRCALRGEAQQAVVGPDQDESLGLDEDWSA